MKTVVAITATHKRPVELARLIASLENSAEPIRGLIVVDNADDEGTRSVAERTQLKVHRVVAGRNLGCGGGLALAEQTAMELYGEVLTHVWILDDDAVVAPDALGAMLSALESEGADLAHALVEDERGKVGWTPGLLDRKKLRVLR